MNKLFNEFPPVLTQQWIETIKKDLKGKDIEKLNRITLDGLKFMPFYRKEDTQNLPITDELPAQYPFLRSSKLNNNWKIAHNFIFSDINQAYKDIELATDRDVDIIGFDFRKKFNLSDDDFRKLLTKQAEMSFWAYENIEEIFYKIETDEIEKDMYLNFDPITYKAFTGRYYKDEQKIWAIAADLLTNEKEKIHPVGINVFHYANAGATIVQQLAFSLSIAAEYIDFATEMNVDLQTILKNIHFNFAFGTEYFMEIAKLRAFRHLFSKMIEAFDKETAKNAEVKIFGTNLRRNKTIYDAYVNMLRTTIETHSAVIGGVDIFAVEPFDIVFKKPDDFSNRIAINQQIIIKEEAFANKVVDPAGGSYYVENVTTKLIENAWKLFLEIQDKGGFCDALTNNTVYNLVAEVAEKEKKLVETGKITLLGTNKFPNRKENLKELKIEKENKISDLSNKNINFNTLKIERLSEDFEKLRMFVEQKTKELKVFLFTYGNISMRRARADFAGNFFAVAGFEIIDNIGFETIEQGIEEFLKANADIIVLCSSDEEYLQMAKQIKSKISDKTIVIAGNPQTRQEIENLGIDKFISIKSNIYEELKKYVNFE
jgi:methylmalonyl-CoA mutase